jgi:hypothetical protein
MLQGFAHLINQRAPDAFRAIIETLPEVASISVFTYTAPQLLQTRAVLTKGENEIFEAALEMTAAYGLPFWDAIMLKCFTATCDVSNLLAAAMFHRNHITHVVNRADVLAGAKLTDLCSKAGDEMIAVTSHVSLYDGSSGHIPLMDFHCPKSDHGIGVVKSVARLLLPDGALVLDSGRSYHAYGRNLMTVQEFLDFLGRAILFSPIIEPRVLRPPTTRAANRLADFERRSSNASSDGACRGLG